MATKLMSKVSMLFLVVISLHREYHAALAQASSQSVDEDGAPAMAFSRLIGRDDDHANIDLEKLDQSQRYELLPQAASTRSSARQAQFESNLARLLAKMFQTGPRTADFMRNQLDRKRNVRQLASTKEDKDYSFVGASSPLSGLSTMQLNTNNNKFLTDFALANQLLRTGGPGSGKWQQKLRDILVEKNGQQQPLLRFANDQDQLLAQQRAFASAELEGANNMALNSANEFIPKTRDKRRRCKNDPNLGVKNPSFCDTDAYFGAADYSMRDVWDSAGRR